MAERQGRKSDAARRANQVIRSRTLLLMLLMLLFPLYRLQQRQLP